MKKHRRSLGGTVIMVAAVSACLLCGCRSDDGESRRENQTTVAEADTERDTETETVADEIEEAEETESSEASTDVTEVEESTETEISDYILPDSDRRYLEWDDVKDIPQEQLRVARNEIYARHGRGFQSQDLQTYFEGKPWYQKTIEPDQFNESLLNDYEKQNVRYLKELEETAGGLSGLAPAPSKAMIDQYGYHNGYSDLSFELKAGTVVDCGEYYQVDALYRQAIEAPGTLEYGDQVTLVFNELTGETRTLECREDGLYPVDEGQYATQYYYTPTRDGSPVALYQDSDDRVEKPIYEGKLYVRKDATDEIAILRESRPITLEKLNGQDNWYNGVYFDQKGYAVRLVFYGD